ncbi:hypothetical protein [Herbiconiux sp. A18JL235]|uniref:Septum formation-related domain-containing protein n=1 Tax=Herbiconiux sp. A18JL235 TaxID=3152363 RepID=A0AB39BGV9_9MICO
MGRHRSSRGLDGRAATRVIVAGSFVLAAALVVALFFAGRAAGTSWAGGGDDGGEADAVATPVETAATPGPTPAQSPLPTQNPTGDPAAGSSGATLDLAAPAPSTQAAAGVQPWRSLAGGECLSSFSSPWAEEFTVVDCGGEHTAQLVATGLLDGDAAATYPGEVELATRMNLLCTAPSVLDPAAAAAVPDLRWQAAFPADEAQWAAGDRRWFCFFSAESGAPLAGSLAVAPAPPAT